MPGHTAGSAAFLLQTERAIVTGDALVTGHPTTRQRRPQVLHPVFATDPDEAMRSLQVLRGLGAEVLLPGHGPAARMSVDDALAMAR